MPDAEGGCPSAVTAGDEVASDAEGMAPCAARSLYRRLGLSHRSRRLVRCRGRTHHGVAGDLAGAPERIRYVLSEGQSEARLSCRAGAPAPVAVFAVENDGGAVPRARVLFEAQGGLTLSTQMEESDAQGRVRVQAVCPSSNVSAGAIVARLAAAMDQEARVTLEVRAGTVARLALERHGEWPDPIRSNAVLGLRLRAYDADDNPVLRAGPVPDDNNEDTRDPLRLQLTIDSAGHAGTLLVVPEGGGDEVPVVATWVEIDPELGAADVQLRVVSRATYEHPIMLRVREPDSLVSSRMALAVAAGAPAQLTVSPSGTVNADLGGAAGEFVFSVWDGDPQTGNRVPDVPVVVQAPASFLFLQGNNRAPLEGRTGPDGRFRVTVLRAEPLGEHQLQGRVTLPNEVLQAHATINVGAGAPDALEMRLDGDALPRVDGMPTVIMRGGTTLAQRLTFRLVNREGGGIPDLGLAVSLQEGNPNLCASFDEPGTTDARGEVNYGPGFGTLRAGGGATDCTYLIAHGNTRAAQRLRVRQVAGRPQRAELRLTLLDGENNLGDVGLRNSMDPPDEWNDNASSREVVLQAWDANQLAPVGLRMWLEVDNCHVNRRSAELDDQGVAVFRVAGGADSNANCVLRARYFNEIGGEQPYVVPSLEIGSNGFVAPTLTAVDFAGFYQWKIALSGLTRRHEWGITGTGIRAPGLWVNGECPQEGACTFVQLLR